ncbi:hypothetical protein ACJX0J_023802, partial [Zea mays]
VFGLKYLPTIDDTTFKIFSMKIKTNLQILVALFTTSATLGNRPISLNIKFMPLSCCMPREGKKPDSTGNRDFRFSFDNRDFRGVTAHGSHNPLPCIVAYGISPILDLP